MKIIDAGGSSTVYVDVGDDDGLGAGKEEFLTVGIVVSGIGSLGGEWLTSVSGCSETDAPAMGEALYPYLNPIRPPLPFRPSASKSCPGCEMDDVDYRPMNR